MLVRLRVTVLLCEAKVYDVHEVTLLAETHQEVVRFDITMYKVLRVDVLYTAYLYQSQPYDHIWKLRTKLPKHVPIFLNLLLYLTLHYHI